VLIAMVIPNRIRYRPVHSHLGGVLTAALGDRPGVDIARVAIPPRTVEAGGKSRPGDRRSSPSAQQR
jgi:hypothetical protein